MSANGDTPMTIDHFKMKWGTHGASIVLREVARILDPELRVVIDEMAKDLLEALENEGG